MRLPSEVPSRLTHSLRQPSGHAFEAGRQVRSNLQAKNACTPRKLSSEVARGSWSPKCGNSGRGLSQTQAEARAINRRTSQMAITKCHSQPCHRAPERMHKRWRSTWANGSESDHPRLYSELHPARAKLSLRSLATPHKLVGEVTNRPEEPPLPDRSGPATYWYANKQIQRNQENSVKN